MTLINEVKKALCRTGIEMDARDIADHLSRLPRHAINVTPAQVSHALHALTTTNGDVIRTRPGLYRHQPAAIEPAPPGPIAHRATEANRVSGNPRRPRLVEDEQPVQIIADSALVMTLLPPSGEPEGARLAKAAAFLLGVAHAQLDRATRLVWCEGAVAAAVELTRHQYAHRAVVVIAPAEVIAEAKQTALTLGLHLQAWTFLTPHQCADPMTMKPSGELDELAISVDDLRAACADPGLVRQPSVPDIPAPRPSPRPASSAGRSSSCSLHSLWQLDAPLYQQRVEGVTGRGNSHTLKRQALLVGRAYAQRWESVVTDEAREQLAGLTGRDWVPGRLFADLLTFAEAHNVQVHGSPVIKDLLRRGFWQHFRVDDHNSQHSSAA